MPSSRRRSVRAARTVVSGSTDFTQIYPHLGSNADLAALIEVAHARGMKVYFDIITNHTADVIGYEQGARQPYVSKDVAPYRDAGGRVFDDRDFAGTSAFPALDPATSFPYRPVLAPGEESLKVPGWLNDVTLYHNRGDTTFVGEDSLYGDFFGLDDLFTEHPRVVDGMIDIYKTWIRDFGVDGFRIDTMKHVDDAFWQRFGPEVLAYARAQGKREFFMFGEVFDTSKSYTSRFTTTNAMQSVLDFPFQAAAQGFAADSKPTELLRTFFEDDDWYTDADSNAYQLPTFLGNHDMGRIGRFIAVANPGANDAELLARDRLAHALMYFSRGNPVIYYGDAQGFTGDGGDQLARQDMFPSAVPEYNDDDLIGTHTTTAEENFDTQHPLYRSIRRLAALTRDYGALRDGVHQHRLSQDAAGVYAFSRIDRREQREYVVALNNAETAKTVAIPTYSSRRHFRRVYGSTARWIRTGAARRLRVIVPPLAAVVYEQAGRIPRSQAAPTIALRPPAPAVASRGRMEVRADVDGRSFYERSPSRPAPAKDGSRSAPTTTRPTACSTTCPGWNRTRRCSTARSCATTAATNAAAGRGAQRAGAGADDRGARRGGEGARPRAAARGRRPGARDPRRRLRAQRGRRPVDPRRLRLVVAGLRGVRRPDEPRAGDRDADPVSRDPDRAGRDAGGQRGARRRAGRAAGDDGDRALQPPGGRLRRLGPAPVGRRDRRRGRDRVDGAAPARGRRRLRRVLRDPVEGRHQAGQLHPAQARRRQRAHDARARRRPLVRPGPRARRSG